MTQPVTSRVPHSSRNTYLAAFGEIKSVIELVGGFVLVPVEIPGPDLAHELGEWLDVQGHPATLIEPDNDERWEHLAASLLETIAAPDAVVLVIGRHDPPRAALRGLQLLNQRRDAIVKHLGRPLLWCGPASFLTLTWECAPDFWSIRSVDHRLLPDPAPPVSTESKALRAVRKSYSDAQTQGDDTNAAHLAIRVADALLSMGSAASTEEAETVVDGALEGLAEEDVHLRAELLLRKAEIAHRRHDDKRTLGCLDIPLTHPDVHANVRLRAALFMADLSRDPEKAASVYREALEYARAHQDLEAEALALMGLGEIESRSGQRIEPVLEPIEQARSIATKLGRADLEAAALATMAVASARLHDKVAARQLLSQAGAIWQDEAELPAAWMVRNRFDSAVSAATEVLARSKAPSAEHTGEAPYTATLRAVPPLPSIPMLGPGPAGVTTDAGDRAAAPPKGAMHRELPAPPPPGVYRHLWILPTAIALAALIAFVYQYRRAEQAEAAMKAANDAAEIAKRTLAQERSAAILGLLASNNNSGEVEALLAGVRAVHSDNAEPAQALTVAIVGLRAAVLAARLSFPLRGHEGPVQAAAFSPDGSRAVTAGADHTARVWGMDYGTPLVVLRGHTDELLNATFSPYGRTVLTTSKDGTARLWDALDGRPLATFQGHSTRITAAAFSPDGRRIVTASTDSIRLWRAEDGGEIAASDNISALIGPRGYISYAAFSPDAAQVYVVDTVRPIIARWDPERKQALPYLDLSSRDNIPTSHRIAGAIRQHIALSPDGTRAVVSYYGLNALLYSLGAGTPPVELKSPKDPALLAERAVFSPDSTRIVTSGTKLSLWNASDGQLQWNAQAPSPAIDYADFSPDGKQIIAGCSDGKLRRWDATNGNLLAMLGKSVFVRAAWLSPNHNSVLTLDVNKTVRIWSARPDLIASSHPWDQDLLMKLACGYLRGQPEFAEVESICKPYLAAKP